jgi:hypothetical protein
MPPDSKTPRLVAGALEADRQVRQAVSSPALHPLQAEKYAVRQQLDAVTDALTWSMDLRERMRRRLLIGELVDARAGTGDLVEEAQQFKRVCCALSWRL